MPSKHGRYANTANKWTSSDRPLNSQHLESSTGRLSVRVRPVRDQWEWSIWIGPKDRRVMHDSGLKRSLAIAKRTALHRLWVEEGALVLDGKVK